MRRGLTILTFLLTGLACSKFNVNKVSTLSTDEASVPSPEATAAAADANPKATPTQETETKPTETEQVSPPSNISGAYLACTEIKAAAPSTTEATINCALKDEQTNNKINLLTAFLSHAWSYASPTAGGLSVTLSEIADPEWQMSAAIKSLDGKDVRSQMGSLKFSLKTKDKAGLEYMESTAVQPPSVQWLSLNGGMIPAQAPVAGSENDGKDNLFICRVYVNGEVVPGKLLTNFNDSSKSICFSVSNGADVQSNSDDGKTMHYRSDALTIGSGVFDDYLEWIPATAGQKPAQALATGMDAAGNPLYTCRALQGDGSIAEQNPGVLRPGASSCVFEYYGVYNVSNYQVLAWKASATKKITDAAP